MIKWYIGQPVVCISSLPVQSISKGKEYTIKGIRLCECGDVQLNVGTSNSCVFQVCSCCGKNFKNDRYYRATRFAPLDVDISELTEILSEPILITK